MRYHFVWTMRLAEFKAMHDANFHSPSKSQKGGRGKPLNFTHAWSALADLASFNTEISIAKNLPRKVSHLTSTPSSALCRMAPSKPYKSSERIDDSSSDEDEEREQRDSLSRSPSPASSDPRPHYPLPLLPQAHQHQLPLQSPSHMITNPQVPTNYPAQKQNQFFPQYGPITKFSYSGYPPAFLSIKSKSIFNDERFGLGRRSGS
jgi:hypothetical protein